MKIKKILSGLLVALVILIQPGMAVMAEEEIPGAEKTQEEILAEEEAKKQASYEIPADTNSLRNWPARPNVYAESAIVMDMDSKAILYSKSADEAHYPASITKLLTTLVALENGELTDKVTFSEESIAILGYDDAQIGMKAGEELNLNDSLYAVLLASANEVSYAVAESLGTKMGGNYDTFIGEMNRRAAELGCTNSHWVNPHGLHDDAHYTSAYDMALIASAVYKRPEFQTFMGTLEYKIGPTNLSAEERVFQQNHKMLWPENYYYYEYASGGKTGFTDQAMTTLVTMTDNQDMRLAVVVLYDYGVEVYNDTRAVTDYVYSNFSKCLLREYETSKDIETFTDAGAYVVLPAGIDFKELERTITLTGGNTGEVVYTYEGQTVGKAEATISENYLAVLENEKESVAGNEKKNAVQVKSNEKKAGFFEGKGLLIIATIAAILLVGVNLKKKMK